MTRWGSTLCSEVRSQYHRHTVDFVNVPFVFWREMLFDLVYWVREQALLLLLLLLLLNFFHPIS